MKRNKKLMDRKWHQQVLVTNAGAVVALTVMSFVAGAVCWALVSWIYKAISG